MKLTRTLFLFSILFFSTCYGDAAYDYLDRLALEAGTDKSSVFNHYTKVYSRYFDTIKDKPIKFFEIGIQEGRSAKLWEDYFPNAELHFGDITFEKVQYYPKRAFYHRMDQCDYNGQFQLAASLGGNFDIIIDDGGHTMQQQKTSFLALFPFVKSGGMYIIEDLQTSYWKEYGGGPGTIGNPVNAPHTFVSYLYQLVDQLNYSGALIGNSDGDKLPPELKEKFDLIDSIHFHKCLCIIIKK